MTRKELEDEFDAVMHKWLCVLDSAMSAGMSRDMLDAVTEAADVFELTVDEALATLPETPAT